jgi:hypothetical protein
MKSKTLLKLKTGTIRARPNSRLSDVEAQKVAPELFAIEVANGIITPEAVRDRARNRRSALHKHLEWDDSEAAEICRLDQARTLIRSVVYEIEIVGPPPDVVTRSYQPALVHIRSSAEDEEPMQGGYVSVARALADEGMRAKILAQAARELDAWVRRYNTLELLAASVEGVARAARKIRKQATKLRRRSASV